MNLDLENIVQTQSDDLVYVRSAIQKWASKRNMNYESFTDLHYYLHKLSTAKIVNDQLLELLAIATADNEAFDNSKRAQRIIRELQGQIN